MPEAGLGISLQEIQQFKMGGKERRVFSEAVASPLLVHTSGALKRRAGPRLQKMKQFVLTQGWISVPCLRPRHPEANRTGQVPQQTQAPELSFRLPWAAEPPGDTYICQSTDTYSEAQTGLNVGDLDICVSNEHAKRPPSH